MNLFKIVYNSTPRNHVWTTKRNSLFKHPHCLMLVIACATPFWNCENKNNEGTSLPDKGIIITYSDGSITTFPGDSTVITKNDITKNDTGTNSTGCTDGWCVIPAGTFTMGSPEDDPCYKIADTEPQHEVTLTHKFIMAATEVTQKDFQELMGYNKALAKTCGDNCPYDRVTWGEAAAFCNALSAKASLTPCYTCEGTGVDIKCEAAEAFLGSEKTIYDCDGYRLPTEAEWEYAYRAGTTTATYNGEIPGTQCAGVVDIIDQIAWYKENSDNQPHPVGQKLPNPWGLYDMAGNVSEWVGDYKYHSLHTTAVTDPWAGTDDPEGAANPTHTPERIVRGGSFDYPASNMRAASRVTSSVDYNLNRGIRCVRTMP